MTCITPMAPTWLFAFWFSCDSWYPWAASMSGSKLYFFPYFSNRANVCSNRFNSSFPLESLICLTLRMYCFTRPVIAPFVRVAFM